MIYYIHMTCLSCGKTKTALLQAADFSQVNRIGGYLAEIGHRMVCKGIVAIANRETEFGDLGFPWLRCSPEGWNIYPPYSDCFEDHHLMVMQHEYEDHQAGRTGY